MAPIRNAAVIFTEVPTGYPEADKHIKYVTDRTIDLDAASTQGGVIVKNLVVSIDPYMRDRMREPEKKSYLPPFELNKPLTNFSVGKVVKSGNIDFKVGQLVYGFGKYEEYTVYSKNEVDAICVLSEAELDLGLPLTTWVGTAGMSGQAAFYGFYYIGQPKKGDVVFITGAAGAVGQIVGQLGIEKFGGWSIRRVTIRRGQFVAVNSSHGQFVARTIRRRQFVVWTIRRMDNSSHK